MTVKKYTSVLLKDLPFQIDFLLDWLSDEEPKHSIWLQDIEYWLTIFGKCEMSERHDVNNLKQFMKLNNIDIIYLNEI